MYSDTLSVMLTLASDSPTLPFEMNNRASQDARPPRPGSRAPRPRFFDHTFHEEQAILVLDEAAQIRYISRVARRLLDLGSTPLDGGSFFDRVHPDHLNRVKWDPVQMTIRGKQRVSWLLRLKTGLGSWRWFKLQAVNCLTDHEQKGIVLCLREREGHPDRVRHVWPTR